MSNNNNFLSSEYDCTISLLNVYLSEWEHRNQILWSQVFKIYYAVLIVILLPNLSAHFQIEIPKLSDFVFRLVGLFLSFVFLYISLGYSIRLRSIDDTCKKLISKLPHEYQRESFTNIKIKKIPLGKIFAPRLSYVLCFALFITLFSLAIILMII